MPTDGERGAELLGDTDADVIDLTDAVMLPAVESPDPYAVLGVERSAPWEQIVAAHKRLARAYHPDAGGDDDLIRELNAAYAELRIRRGR